MRDLVVHQAIPVAVAATALRVAGDGGTAPARLAAVFGAARRRGPAAGHPHRNRLRLLVRVGRRRLPLDPVPPGDPLRRAAGLDVLAACLRVGLPVPTAVAAAADEMTGPVARDLHRVAELIRLGADPAQAWQPAMARPELTGLARRARRTARTGAALAEAAAAIAGELRAAAGQAAHAAGQRAGVLITGPLGLCFLPAFLCLGVAPVVIGLATKVFQRW